MSGNLLNAPRTNKWYIPNVESTLDNETHELLWSFKDINGSSNLSLTTRPRDSSQKKRTYRIVNYAVPTNHRIRLKESKEIDKYLDLLRELKKMMEHQGKGNTSSNWCARNNTQKKSKGTGIFGNKRISRDYPNDSIIKITLNTEKSPEDFRRFAVTQIPGKNYQLV